MTFHSKQLKLEAKHLVGALRNALPPYKSPKFLAWVKNKYPETEIHHILGSVIGRKRTDYLVVPLMPETHRKIQKTWYKFVPVYLPTSLLLLMAYAEEVFGLEVSKPESIEELRNLIETIYKKEKEK